MAVPYRVYCGTLTCPGSTGAQAITGVGFQPKALILWSVNTAISAPEFNHFNYWSFGITDGTNHVAKTSISFDNQGSTDVNHSVVTNAVILAEATDGTVQHRATLTSFDADGFTINWTNVFNAEDRRYHFIAIGGSEVECQVGVFNANTSTGAQAVTGVGFRPTGMLFAPAQNSGTSEDRLTYPALGWTDGTNQFASAVFSENAAAAANSKRYQRVDKCAALLDASTGAVLGEAGITSFDEDGFTVNWTTAAASALRVYYLAFSNFPFKVGSLTQPAASSSVETTGLDFQPGVVLLQSVNASASTSVQDDLDFSMGAAMARHSSGNGAQTVTQRSVWMADKDAADPVQSSRYYSEALIYAAGVVAATASALACSATLASMDEDGFTLAHTADGTQREIGWVAWSSPWSHRNKGNGQDIELYGHDNHYSGRDLTIIGNNNKVYGSDVTVKGNRNFVINVDGTPRTVSGDDQFIVNGSVGTGGAVDLDDLSDVVISSPSTGEVLKYDGTNWVNDTDATGGGSPSGSDPADIILTDAYASRPAAATEGRLFLPSDGFALDRDTGAAWAPWGPIFPMTPPVDGDFSWVNQGGASVSTTNGGIYLNGPATSGFNVRARVKSAPATPYTITACMLLNIVGSNWQSAGLCFRQSSDGKFHTFSIVGGQTQGLTLNSAKHNSATSHNSTYLSRPFSVGLLWLQISDNGTNRICRYSCDGQHFVTYTSIGRTDFLTADQIGFFVNEETVSFPVGLLLLSWKET